MDDRDIVTDVAVPFLLYLDPQQRDNVAHRTRLGVQSSDASRVESAVEGLAWWMIHSSATRIPVPPDDLISELVHSVESRRRVALKACVDTLRFVIREIPDYPPASWVPRLSVALEYLLVETVIQKNSHSEYRDPIPETIHIEERPEIRAAAARLARQLAERPAGRIQPLETTLAAWRQATATDEFPEVRLAWPHADDLN